ncbi:MAG: FAD-binding protein [Acidimicrobiaceae bacterium]|nr:FAD-binding protein [Acidimicrobiaceae bacterium]MDE0161240.1 FAD-binding protein [Acidimicrobiaceae bacterium]
MADFDDALTAFAAEVGTDGPVCVRGGGTRWSLGGEAAAGTREVLAPAGIVAFEPAEMTVRVRAGTPVAALHEELADSGQRTALPERAGGTVGGALMAGESSIARLGLGPVRDALLQARYVCADGRIANAGAGTVKNVSGFDLCRLLVGSLGTLGLVGEVLLRTFPVGEAERWVRLPGADPGAARSCHTAASVLWDGADVWTLLSGYAVDVDDDRVALAALGACEDVDGPPQLPPHRWACTPAEAAAFGSRNGAAGPFVAEIGVGVVHASGPQPARPVEPGVAELNRRFKERFDPTGRLNPGRDPLRKP